MNIVKSPIISCSRRTDIPAFLMDWVIERFKLGFVDVVNPFNRKQISRISLDPKTLKMKPFLSPIRDISFNLQLILPQN